LAARACKNGLLDDFEELYWKIVLFISFAKDGFPAQTCFLAVLSYLSQNTNSMKMPWSGIETLLLLRVPVACWQTVAKLREQS
jgi:hypothetical protein